MCVCMRYALMFWSDLQHTKKLLEDIWWCLQPKTLPKKNKISTFFFLYMKMNFNFLLFEPLSYSYIAYHWFSDTAHISPKCIENEGPQFFTGKCWVWPMPIVAQRPGGKGNDTLNVLIARSLWRGILVNRIWIILLKMYRMQWWNKIKPSAINVFNLFKGNLSRNHESVKQWTLSNIQFFRRTHINQAYVI